MPLRQHLTDIHGYHTGEKGDNRAIPAAIIQLTKQEQERPTINATSQRG